MKATERYFPMVLFIIPYEVVLTFESVEEFSNFFYTVQGGTDF